MHKCIFGNKKIVQITIASLIVIVAIVVAIIYSAKKSNEISAQEASAKTETFINEYLMPSGSQAKITETSEEYDLYKMKIDIGSEEPVESYVTKDGKLFFPQALEITPNQTADNNTQANSTPTPVNVPKSDKPEIELFVMSYCPFGTQAEKGILEAVKSLGSSVDFKIKFVDYIMHGEKEVYENLTQYCIQKEEPNKFINYLECFLKDGDNNSCIVNTNVDVVKLEDCKTLIDKEYKITELLKDETTWLNGTFPQFNVDSEMNLKYGVQGSPTLIVNGVEMDSSRSADAYLKTICASFKEAPEVCNLSLSTETPTAGFGYTGTTSEGVC